MTIEFDEKGKFYTDIISKVTVPATIQTTMHRIKGLVHIRPYGRFKDELDRDEPFLAVTSATIFDQKGEAVSEVEFMIVRREQIIWVIPDEDGSQDELESEE
jgi:hypothetical protein